MLREKPLKIKGEGSRKSKIRRREKKSSKQRRRSSKSKSREICMIKRSVPSKRSSKRNRGDWQSKRSRGLFKLREKEKRSWHLRRRCDKRRRCLRLSRQLQSLSKKGSTEKKRGRSLRRRPSCLKGCRPRLEPLRKGKRRKSDCACLTKNDSNCSRKRDRGS